MSRKGLDFPRSVKVARIKHATRDGVVYCEAEGCGRPAKRFHLHHENPAKMTGKPTFENCRVLCIPCHAAVTKDDVREIAKAARTEAKHVGAVQPKGTIPARPPSPKKRPVIIKTEVPDRRPLLRAYLAKK